MVKKINRAFNLKVLSWVMICLAIPLANTLTFNKYNHNPLNLTDFNSSCGYTYEQSTEFSSLELNGTIQAWFRHCTDWDSYILYTNSSDGINWTIPTRLPELQGYAMPHVKYYRGEYLMTVERMFRLQLEIWNSSDGITWTDKCNGSIIDDHQEYFNSELFDLEDKWGMYLTHGGWGTHYWQSKDICGRWNGKSQVLISGEATSTIKLNDTYYIFFGERKVGDIWNISLGKTKDLSQINFVAHDIIGPNQGWELNKTILTVPRVIQLKNQTLLYYDGNQNNTGLVFIEGEDYSSLNWTNYTIVQPRISNSKGSGKSSSDSQPQKNISITVEFG